MKHRPNTTPFDSVTSWVDVQYSMLEINEIEIRCLGG